MLGITEQNYQTHLYEAAKRCFYCALIISIMAVITCVLEALKTTRGSKHSYGGLHGFICFCVPDQYRPSQLILT